MSEARKCNSLATILLFCALIIGLFVSVSLPSITPLGIIQASNIAGIIQANQLEVEGINITLTGINLGIWAACFVDSDNGSTCFEVGSSYSVTVSNSSDPKSNVQVIGSSYTRGLVIQPIASVATSIAVLFGICSIQFEENMKANNYLADSPLYVAAFATTLTLIAIAVDMALYVRAVDVFNNYFAGIKTQPGPGFWMTLTCLVLTFICSLTLLEAKRERKKEQRKFDLESTARNSVMTTGTGNRGASMRS
jgi:hypothetical protein